MTKKFSRLRHRMSADAQAEATTKAQAMLAELSVEDETDYLLSNLTNAQRLMHSAEQVKAGKAKTRTLVTKD